MKTSKKSEIKAAFGKAINLNDLERAVCEERRKREQELRSEKLDVADVTRHWAREHRNDWAYDGRAKLWQHWNRCYWEALEHRSAALDLDWKPSQRCTRLRSTSIPPVAWTASSALRRLSVR